jgi:hypothetical protein
MPARVSPGAPAKASPATSDHASTAGRHSAPPANWASMRPTRRRSRRSARCRSRRVRGRREKLPARPPFGNANRSGRCSSGVSPSVPRQRSETGAARRGRCIAGRTGAGGQRGIARNSPGPVDLPSNWRRRRCRSSAAGRARFSGASGSGRTSIVAWDRRQRFQILQRSSSTWISPPVSGARRCPGRRAPRSHEVEQVRQRGDLGGVDAAPHEVAALLGA